MPRLQIGQTATGIAAKAKLKADSVNARLSLLQEFELAPPTSRTQHAIANFMTLAQLAEWSDPNLGITPMSAKTLKKYLVKEVNGGYAALQTRALAVAAACDPSAQQSTLKAKADDFAEPATDAVILMTARYQDLLERLSRLRSDHEQLDEALRAHFRLFQNAKPHLRVVKK